MTAQCSQKEARSLTFAQLLGARGFSPDGVKDLLHLILGGGDALQNLSIILEDDTIFEGSNLGPKDITKELEVCFGEVLRVFLKHVMEGWGKIGVSKL